MASSTNYMDHKSVRIQVVITSAEPFPEVDPDCHVLAHLFLLKPVDYLIFFWLHWNLKISKTLISLEFSQKIPFMSGKVLKWH